MANIIQAAFTSGEWSPRLFGRVDLEKYTSACSTLENMILMPHGATKKRMGTEFVAQLESENVVLVPFIFNNSQTYVLVFSPKKINFFKDGGIIPLEVATPYTLEDIKSIRYTQSADVLYLVSPKIKPHKLLRTGDDFFKLEAVTFTNQPKEWVANNYPSAIAFHHQRLWFAATPKQPQSLWASRIADFENFTNSFETEEDCSLAITLLSEQVNAIHWLMSSKTLLVGTSGGEWSISGANTDSAITVKTIQATRNSNYGDGNVTPVLIGRSVIHVSSDTKRVRELAYSFSDDGYVSTDISILAEHITSKKVKSLSYAANPDGIIWCAMQDGSLAACTYLRSQDVIAWHRHTTLGKVISLISIPGNNETLNTDTYFAVKRKNGVFLERMLPSFEADTTDDLSCFFVDSGLSYSGKPVQTIYGLEYLEGSTVAILADGATHEQKVVQNGKVVLNEPASKIVVGLPYTSKLAPMLPELDFNITTQGKKKRLIGINVRLYNSLGLQYSLYNKPEIYDCPNRDIDAPMDKAPKLFSGDIYIRMPDSWSKDGRYMLQSDKPLPLTLILCVSELSSYE